MGGLRRRTVLFLMAQTGAGHSSAANAIARAMQQAGEPDWHPLIVDGVQAGCRFPLRHGVFLYGPATKYCPRLFGAFFHRTDSPERVRTGRRLCRPFMRDGLRRLIQFARPDVIVSTHPFFNHAVPEALRECGVRVPFVAVVTDLFTIHQVWHAPEVDAWVAPSEMVRQFLLASGVADQRIHSLGLPIDPAFAQPPESTARERRAALGLDPDRPVALLMGGGEGVGGLGVVARAMEREELDAQLVIVTGHNQALRRTLLRRRHAYRMPVMVLGFVENMPELMRAADVLVSKAGSLTLSEALACELPIILMGALPGQEEGNVAFVEKSQVGVYAPSAEDVVWHLRRLLGSERDTLERMRANARAFKHPHAACEVARLIFAALPPATSRSAWEPDAGAANSSPVCGPSSQRTQHATHPSISPAISPAISRSLGAASVHVAHDAVRFGRLHMRGLRRLRRRLRRGTLLKGQTLGNQQYGPQSRPRFRQEGEAVQLRRAGRH